ncbi:MAG: flagellar motor switch protein FliN [Pseudomonadota bacterium]
MSAEHKITPEDEIGFEPLETAPEEKTAPGRAAEKLAPAIQSSVYDVPVTISAVLGKTKIDVGSLMRLGDGAIIELDRKVGEPIDLYVNDRLVARGELVMVEGSLGVTMTEVVKQNDL